MRKIKSNLTLFNFTDAPATASIDSVGAQGDGLAEAGGKRIFVAFSAPGDRLRLGVQGGRGEILEIIQPGADRVLPPCRHFGVCGGCALQHLSDDFVADWKRQLIIALLKRQNIETSVRPTHTCPPATRRRAAFAVERNGGDVRIGFRARRSHRLVSIEECHVLDPAIIRALPGLAALASPFTGAKAQMRVNVTLSDTGLDVNLVTGKSQQLTLAQHTRFAEAADALDLARLSLNMEPLSVRRAPLVHFAGIPVAIPPGAFLQASHEAQTALTALVIEALGEAGGKLFDLFAGCGSFSFPAARRHHVHAFEGDAAMAAAFAQAANHAGAGKITVSHRDLFQRPVMAGELASTAAVIFNPPQAGAPQQAAQLAAAKIRRVIGVSCDPASFARDARILTDGGYVLQWVAPVDQFRWSTRIELVGLFTRA